MLIAIDNTRYLKIILWNAKWNMLELWKIYIQISTMNKGDIPYRPDYTQDLDFTQGLITHGKSEALLW